MGAHDLSMFSSQDIILFDLPGSKTLNTTRKLHIRRLYDVLQLCLLRDDLVRARKAWAILVRCKEVHWKALWKTGILLLDEFEYEFDQDRETAKRIDYLSTMMLQQSEDKESILQELILRYVKAGKYRRALDELELYIPSPPYDTNPVLHLYAGLLCLYLSQGHLGTEYDAADHGDFNPGMLRDAQVFFERARILDPDNEFAASWIEKLPSLSQQQSSGPRNSPDSDEEPDKNQSDDAEQRNKRMRR